MQVLVADPFVTIDDADIKHLPLDDLLGRAEYVVCLAVANEQTENLIGQAALARMQPHAFSINLSRGNLVDEQALADALREGRIAGAAMDVGRAAGSDADAGAREITERHRHPAYRWADTAGDRASGAGNGPAGRSHHQRRGAARRGSMPSAGCAVHDGAGIEAVAVLLRPWVVVAVTFITMAIGVNARTAFSLFFPPILSEFGWERGITAGAFSFGSTVVSGFVSPLIGRLMDRSGPRAVMELGVALMAGGMLLAPLTREPGISTSPIGVMVGAGSVCLGYSGQSLFLPNWFIRRRGMAMGIAFAGVGIGSVDAIALGCSS